MDGGIGTESDCVPMEIPEALVGDQWSEIPDQGVGLDGLKVLPILYKIEARLRRSRQVSFPRDPVGFHLLNVLFGNL